MCYYYAHKHCCGHTEMILDHFCTDGQMIQKKCPRGKEGKILETIPVENPCSKCAAQVRSVESGAIQCRG